VVVLLPLLLLRRGVLPLNHLLNEFDVIIVDFGAPIHHAGGLRAGGAHRCGRLG
jgi:hypothetical protein